MLESDIMWDFDDTKYTEAYCRKQKCRKCEGTDQNGEPNGYGCVGLENRVKTMYYSILNRRRDKLGIWM